MIKKLRAPNGMVDVLQDLSMVASASYFSPATKLLPEEGGYVCVCVRVCVEWETSLDTNFFARFSLESFSTSPVG